MGPRQMACLWLELGPDTRERMKTALTSTSVFVVGHVPPNTDASANVPRVCFNCLLLLPKALQDQQVGLTQASFKLLLLPSVSDC